MFHELLSIIDVSTPLDFNTASAIIVEYIEACDSFSDILKQIGTIPESIEHDSKQEKLFSKASDAALARAFRELGLRSTVLRERGDSADVLAESCYHGYTLVADAKAFRLSRTAKNQKDFKVTALSGWRKDADFAVLCAPYFQYPVSKSQIFAQAVDNNVCLLSWEHLIFLIENNIQETETINLSSLWNVSGNYAKQCVVAEKKNCFMPVINQAILAFTQKTDDDFIVFLRQCRNTLSGRADEEAQFWKDEIVRISSFTKEQAIAELRKTRKIDEKIAHIETFVAGIKV